MSAASWSSRTTSCGWPVCSCDNMVEWSLRIDGAVENRLLPGSYTLDAYIGEDLGGPSVTVQGLRLLQFTVEGTTDGRQAALTPGYSGPTNKLNRPERIHAVQSRWARNRRAEVRSGSSATISAAGLA